MSDLTEQERNRLQQHYELFRKQAKNSPSTMHHKTTPRTVYTAYKAIEKLEDKAIGEATVQASRLNQMTDLTSATAGRALNVLEQSGHVEELAFGGTTSKKYRVTL